MRNTWPPTGTSTTSDSRTRRGARSVARATSVITPLLWATLFSAVMLTDRSAVPVGNVKGSVTTGRTTTTAVAV